MGSDNSANESPQDGLRRLWLKIVRIVPQFTLHSLVLLSLISFVSDLPPELSAIAASAGVEALIAWLQKMASGQEVSDDEIRENIQAAVQELEDVDRVLAENQRLLGHLFRRLDIIEFAVRNTSDEVSRRILDQLANYQELVDEMQSNAVLSIYPRPTRPNLFDIPLIGREADLSLLQENSAGDFLLLGQPGSGKSFLLYHLARETDGYFIHGGDRNDISNQLRFRQPKLLIVDDAHTEDGLELVKDLLQLRKELELHFSIFVSCWPGREASIREPFGLPDTSIHSLERLNRDQIVQVINAVGLQGPIPLVREIVDQAEGLPGLAVTLARLCLQGDIRQVALGNALARSITEAFEPWVGEDATLILAALAVGGDSGLPLELVKNTLDYSHRDISGIVNNLAAGGVIYVNETGETLLTVRPDNLRYALIRDVFFAEPIPRLSLNDLILFLNQAPIVSHATLSLIGAVAVGANIPFELLTNLVERSNSPTVWRRFASLGANYAEWVLQNHPETLITVARPALFYVPDTTIPLLLERAIGDERPLHSTPEHPIRILEDWVKDVRTVEDATNRRTVLWRSVRTWIRAGGDLHTGSRAFRAVLFPTVEYTEPDPGIGNSFTISSGCLPPESLQAIQALWPEILEILTEIEINDWKPICDMIEPWADDIGFIKGSLPSDTASLMLSFVRQMLHDLMPLAREQPAFLHWVQQVVELRDLELDIPLDPVFEALYPPIGSQKQHDALLESLRELASEWCTSEPTNVIRLIESLESAAGELNIPSRRMTSDLYYELAERVASPISWLEAAQANGLPAEFIAPFLDRAIELNETGWVELAFAFLLEPTQKAAVITSILPMKDPPADLLEDTLRNLEGASGLIHRLFMRTPLPEGITRLLLNHSDSEIAGVTAWCEWDTEPKGIVRNNLYSEWHRAIVGYEIDDHATYGYWIYRMAEIFKDDPKIAFDWLSSRFLNDNLKYLRKQSLFQSAIAVLDSDQRIRLLPLVPIIFGTDNIIQDIVGNGLTVYQELLNTDHLQRYHLAPLGGHPDNLWIDKAQLALEAGYSTEQVALATYQFGIKVWSGKESAMWQRWVNEFTGLCNHVNEDIQQIGEIGRSYALEQQRRALEREKHREIFGDDT